MFERFIFMFHIFVLEDSGLISRIDSQFVFNNEESCRIVEAFIHNVKDPNNCILGKTSSSNNKAWDNLNILLSMRNS